MKRESGGEGSGSRRAAEYVRRAGINASGALWHDLALRRDHLREAARSADRVAVLPLEVRFLVARGLPRRHVWRAITIAARRGQAVGAVLLDEGEIDPDLYYRCLAAELGVPFLEEAELAPDPRFAERLPDIAAGRLSFLAIAHDEANIRVAIAPSPARVAKVILHMARYPEVRERISVTAPHYMEMVRGCQIAIQELRRARPLNSASFLLTKTQKQAFACVSAGVGCVLWLEPVAGLVIALVAAGGVFIAAGLVRVVAAMDVAAPLAQAVARGGSLLERNASKRSRFADKNMLQHFEFGAASYREYASHFSQDAPGLPRYSLLVPLYREAAIIADLLAALRRLDYPHERLQVLLIVEGDDAETRAALRHAALDAPFEICIVPPFGPRTKPKALAYGLRVARGDLITVYDAEDRPEPDQLRKVAEVFADAPPDLGCVQARLAIDHAAESFFARHLALEYALQFDVLLPWMAKLRLPIRLGGTSNHIRRRALEACGGWDPYNVTEDLDLGIRLLRDGWRLTSVHSTTWEEAPLTFSAWCHQRIRWHKGWLQTWFVHTREPIRFLNDIGMVNACVIAAIFTGTLLSLVAHPAFVALLVTYAVNAEWRPASSGFADDLVLSVGVICLVSGYGGLFFAVQRAALMRNLRFGWKELLSLPLYWLLMSAVLAVAVVELFRKPFHWRKTAHGLAKRRSGR